MSNLSSSLHKKVKIKCKTLLQYAEVSRQFLRHVIDLGEGRMRIHTDKQVSLKKTVLHFKVVKNVPKTSFSRVRTMKEV